MSFITIVQPNFVAAFYLSVIIHSAALIVMLQGMCNTFTAQSNTA